MFNFHLTCTSIASSLFNSSTITPEWSLQPLIKITKIFLSFIFLKTRLSLIALPFTHYILKHPETSSSVCYIPNKYNISSQQMPNETTSHCNISFLPLHEPSFIHEIVIFQKQLVVSHLMITAFDLFFFLSQTCLQTSKNCAVPNRWFNVVFAFVGNTRNRGRRISFSTISNSIVSSGHFISFHRLNLPFRRGRSTFFLHYLHFPWYLFSVKRPRSATFLSVEYSLAT